MANPPKLSIMFHDVLSSFIGNCPLNTFCINRFPIGLAEIFLGFTFLDVLNKKPNLDLSQLLAFLVILMDSLNMETLTRLANYLTYVFLGISGMKIII